MNIPKINNRTLLLTMILVSMFGFAMFFACTSESEEEPETMSTTEDMTCPDLEAPPGVGDQPLGPPPGMPYIFSGTAYVDGAPAPEGELLYVKLTASRSREVTIGANGKYRDIIHGPVHDPDKGVPFVFCLGDPEGSAVKSAERIEYEDIGTFKEVELDLNFPMLPNE